MTVVRRNPFKTNDELILHHGDQYAACHAVRETKETYIHANQPGKVICQHTTDYHCLDGAFVSFIGCRFHAREIFQAVVVEVTFDIFAIFFLYSGELELTCSDLCSVFQVSLGK